MSMELLSWEQFCRVHLAIYEAIAMCVILTNKLRVIYFEGGRLVATFVAIIRLLFIFMDDLPINGFWSVNESVNFNWRWHCSWLRNGNVCFQFHGTFPQQKEITISLGGT